MKHIQEPYSKSFPITLLDLTPIIYQEKIYSFNNPKIYYHIIVPIKNS